MRFIQINEALCPKNHHCPTIGTCPVGAITQKTPYHAPEIDEQKCTKCGVCTRSCYAFSCTGC